MPKGRYRTNKWKIERFRSIQEETSGTYFMGQTDLSTEWREPSIRFRKITG